MIDTVMSRVHIVWQSSILVILLKKLSKNSIHVERQMSILATSARSSLLRAAPAETLSQLNPYAMSMFGLLMLLRSLFIIEIVKHLYGIQFCNIFWLVGLPHYIFQAVLICTTICVFILCIKIFDMFHLICELRFNTRDSISVQFKIP